MMTDHSRVDNHGQQDVLRTDQTVRNINNQESDKSTDGISCVALLPHNTDHETVARTTDQGTVKRYRTVRDNLWTVRSKARTFLLIMY